MAWEKGKKKTPRAFITLDPGLLSELDVLRDTRKGYSALTDTQKDMLVAARSGTNVVPYSKLKPWWKKTFDEDLPETTLRAWAVRALEERGKVECGNE